MLNQANQCRARSWTSAILVGTFQLRMFMTIYESESSSLPPLRSHLKTFKSFKDFQDSSDLIIIFFSFELKAEVSLFQQLQAELAPELCRHSCQWLCVQATHTGSVIPAAVNPAEPRDPWQGPAVTWDTDGVCAGGIWESLWIQRETQGASVFVTH